jgi:hypothetical protein
VQYSRCLAVQCWQVLVLGALGRLLPPRPTSLFGRTHSRPSGKVRKGRYLPHAPSARSTLVHPRLPSFHCRFLSWARRCRSHSLIVSALHQLSPSTCFLLLDEGCKSQRVLELLCVLAVVIIVIASDKRTALAHSSLSSLIGERAPFLRCVFGFRTPNSSKQRPHSRLTLLDDNVTTLLTISY